MMNRNHRLLTCGLVTLALVRAPAAPAQQSPSALAFQQLTSLVGVWRGVQDRMAVEVTYTLIADGSVLMEEFRPRVGATMVTMFSVDGDRLLATHYCAARNQPQMATAVITQPQVRSLAFSLTRVTGLTSPDDWHNTGVVVTLEDADHLTQEWTYRYQDTTGTAVFRYTRVR